MMPFQYIKQMIYSNRKLHGFAIQMGIIFIALYAGSIYPPEWVSRKAIQDYILSVLPFAIILTLAIIIAIYKESKINYDGDDDTLQDDASGNENNKDIEEQRGS